MALDINKTSLLIHSDNVNGSIDIIDSSAISHILTMYGDVQHKTDRYKFPASAIYADGYVDRISTPIHDSFDMGSGAFTMGGWYCPRAKIAAYPRIIQLGTEWGDDQINICDRHNSAPTKFFVQAAQEPGFNLLESTTSVVEYSWYHLLLCRDDSGNIYFFVNGNLEDSATGKTFNVNTVGKKCWFFDSGTGNECVQGWGEEFFILKDFCMHTESFIPPEAPYSFFGIQLSSGLIQRWGYPIENSLSEKWGDSTITQRGLNIYWRSSRLLQSGCKETWGDALQLAGSLVGAYSLLSNPQAGLIQRWSILEGAVAAGLIEAFDVKNTTPISSGLNQFWNIIESGIFLQSNALVVIVGGINLQSITECSAGLNEEQAFNTATVTIFDRGEFSAIAKGHNVTITQFGRTFEYFVSGKDPGWEVTGSEDGPNFKEQFVIRCESKTSALHRPYAVDLNNNWYAGGSAATLLQELADIEGIIVDFQATDFLVPKNYLVAEKETPWEIIQKITGPLLLTEQTEPDGRLIIRESYPNRPANWNSALPTYSLSADGGFFRYAEQHNDDQIVYNMVTIQDKELAVSKTLTLESEDISAQEKYVRAWEVPWVGNFTLSHSGDNHVGIYTDGVIQKELPEIIEIIDGSGKVSKPTYSVKKINYLKDDLGSIEFFEDGTVKTTIVGNSLLEITYNTQYFQFRVRDNKIEKLQVYINGVQV